MGLNEDMARLLEETGLYRVLRRLPERGVINEPDGSEERLALAIDLETTGLNPDTDEVIEIAMVPFTFCPTDGRIFEVREPFHALQQPKTPIPAEITEITGIDDAMVEGHAIDQNAVEDFIEPAVLIIAHHAEFDRPFAEKLTAAFWTKCWACSMSQIEWHREGLLSRGLASLLGDMGFFYDGGHRATQDAMALVELLARPLPKSGTLALATLLEAARRPTWRIWATDSPFKSKDVLKARGYRWNPGDDGRPKSWYTEVSKEQIDAELAFLHTRSTAATAIRQSNWSPRSTVSLSGS